MHEVMIKATYNGKTYSFYEGSKAYIFHSGIYNDFDKKHGEDKILEYVELVESCYIKDDNATPLGALSDYIAENWEEVQDKSIRQILENFYWRIL